MNSFPLFLLSSLLIFHSMVEEVNGFSIKIIHRDSPESPLYPGNLTLQQRLDRLHGQIESYVRVMANQSESVDPKSIRAPLSSVWPYYTAVVGLGTFDQPQAQYMSTHLLLDTGGDMIWTQCENCRDCFFQESPLYAYSRSKSFKNLPCDGHPLCFPGKCIDGKCTYADNYGAGNIVTAGYLASEKFTFSSDSGGTESVEDVVFGCGFDQKGFDFGQLANNPITGILGLGYGTRSLAAQLGQREREMGLMSHCIPHWMKGLTVSTFLKFGSDAQFRPETTFVTTPLIRGAIYPYYYVDLLDISVNGYHLNYPPGTFALRPDGGGCILDTGSPLIMIKRDAYETLKHAILYYFEPLPHPPESKNGFDLCYFLDGHVTSLPTITFHFRNADFHVNDGAFFTAGDYMCMTIAPHDFTHFSIIIGGLGQSDYRVLYNLVDRTVSFGKEQCITGS